MHTPHVRNLCGRQATKAINRVCLYYMQFKVDVKHFLRLLFFYVLRKYGKRSVSAEDVFGDKLGTHTAVVRTVATSCNAPSRRNILNLLPQMAKRRTHKWVRLRNKLRKQSTLFGYARRRNLSKIGQTYRRPKRGGETPPP